MADDVKQALKIGAWIVLSVLACVVWAFVIKSCSSVGV